ncbi:sugar phosphate isomerase/epimerase family protein [Alicyclobacillus herbarius]|uniref:sugar phosphate isomerase/epimerase family protein n=1 Tax=Alicyclobacillus herbarius TaxID=122960 RepID=UPI000424C33C|nr:sugar phosphate isomerase/epimerase family protein [Alicyclobacillus herbarius]
MTTPIGARIPSQVMQQGIAEAARLLHEIGLTAIDVPQLTPDAAQAARQYGLVLGTSDVQNVPQLLNPNPDVRRQAVESVCQQIQAVAALGGKAVFMCLVPENLAQPISESLEYFAAGFPTIADVCEQTGVRVALEGWPGPGPYYPTLGYTPEVWRAMFARVPSTAIGLCFDPSHLVRLGIDYLRVLEEFADRIVHVHGKDTELLPEQRYLYGFLSAKLDPMPPFSEGSWRYTIPGSGEVDWHRIAYRLQRIGYRGCVSIELEDARYWGSLGQELQGIQKAFTHLATCFA